MGKVSFGGSMSSPVEAGMEPHNPSIVFWGNGQTSKLQDESSSTARSVDSDGGTDGTERFVFLRWQISEKYFGATDDMVQFIAGDDIGDVAFQIPPATGEPNTRKTNLAFKMTPGYWSFYGDMKLGGDSSTGQQVRLMRVDGDAGDADELLAESIPGPNEGAQEPLDPNTGRVKPFLKTPPIKVGADDILYLVDGDVTNDHRQRSHFMDLEYFGP